jgi:hypothetical protein
VQVEAAGIEPAFEDRRADLELLLDQAELFAEYPLRLIEATRWRELNQVLQYDYRDLRGDHPLVPLEQGQASTHRLEAGSLYLAARSAARGAGRKKPAAKAEGIERQLEEARKDVAILGDMLRDSALAPLSASVPNAAAAQEDAQERFEKKPKPARSSTPPSPPSRRPERWAVSPAGSYSSSETGPSPSGGTSS